MNIGVIGCGKIARVCHIPEYENNKDAVLYGFYNRTEDKAQTLAEKYGAKVYSTVEDILNDPNIDAVSICTVHSLHAPIAIKALQAGKHVLCEKPMGITYDECIEMTKAAEKSGKLLLINQTLRLSPAYLKAKELFDVGKIGRLLTFSAALSHSGPENWSPCNGESWFFDKNSAKIGVICDLGVHLFDFLSYISNESFTGTFAKLETLEKSNADGSPISVEDNAVCILKLSGGAVGNVNVSWTCHGARESYISLFGTEGAIKICNGAVILEKTNAASERFEFTPSENSGVMDHFIRCINGEQEPMLSGKSLLNTMRTLFACIESNENKKWVDIPAEE